MGPRFFVAGAASPGRIVGGLREMGPGFVVAGAASPAPVVGGLREMGPGFVVAGVASPAPVVGGLREMGPGFVVAGAARLGPIAGGLREMRRGCVVLRRVPARDGLRRMGAGGVASRGHRSFRVVRARRARAKDTIQKRTTILGSAQPASS